MTTVQYFGIRHHGPGSARQLVHALEETQPTTVLIEGPSDASDLLPLLAHKDMVTPVALLTYPKDAPEGARFFPFTEFSPEYQAVLWAVNAGAELRFIDLPSTWKSADIPEEVTQPPQPETFHDPIGTLAHTAGYEDGESWWRELVEENPNPGPVFDAIADAMTALRENEGELTPREAAREAHMRLEISKAQKSAIGPIAVVCGAYHVPALRAKYTAKTDRELIKGGPKRKTLATWAPWTSPRLAFSSGYGAGVHAPAWCQHIWSAPKDGLAARWLAKIARELRDNGHIVSTASIIEAERLSTTLTAMRGRSAPGFEELREASIACLCFGERLVWDTIAADLLIGRDVGSIPDDVPLAPLLEDLKHQQIKARLKPESLERELSVDLRSDSGLFRSTLLHQLTILNVPWGRLTDSGRSRGTFREKWVLAWEPEYAVQLVENLVYGPTIAQAASGRLRATFDDIPTLTQLADTVLAALRAQLPDAAETGIAHLAQRAAQSSDCQDMLSALEPLASILRYGEARQTDTSSLLELFNQIAIQSALGLGYASHNLDSDASQTLRLSVITADGAIRLIESEENILNHWVDALKKLLSSSQASKLVVGCAAQLLYSADDIRAEDAANLLQKLLSPGTPIPDASAFFEGFFEGNGSRLIYDTTLRSSVDAWLASLDSDIFTENLPLMRRVFSTLDQSERARLLDALFGRKSTGLPVLKLVGGAQPLWDRQLARISDILTKGSSL